MKTSRKKSSAALPSVAPPGYLTTSQLRHLASIRDAEKPRFELARHLFPKQDRFGLSKHRQRTACCSRRAGKSEACVGVLLDTALARAGCVALYVTKTRINAKRIIWATLKRVNREYRLGGEPNEGELSLAFPNGSTVYLAGASNRDEIEKFRGLPIGVVVVDESQMLLGYLEQMVDEVLAAALMDYDGMLVLVGTPAPVPAGYFYDCIQSPAWEHYAWTVFDNPFIEKKSGKTPQQHLEQELARRGVTVDDPVIQREWFGRWVHDPNALVFRYDATKNHFDSLPAVASAWEHVIGVDLGYDDADAISVQGWTEDSPNLYEVEEWTGAKQSISDLMARIAKLFERYSPLTVVMDTGGLGKKIADEISRRTGIPIKAADRARKFEHIELLNDAMRTGRFFARKGSRFAQDSLLVEWDKSNPEKPCISERFHSDQADAVLYAFTEALHWLHVPLPEPKPKPGSAAWLDGEAQRMEDAELEEVEEQLRAEREAENEKDWI